MDKNITLLRIYMLWNQNEEAEKACGGRWSMRGFRGIIDLGHENKADVAKWRNRKTSQAKKHGKHKSVSSKTASCSS